MVFTAVIDALRIKKPKIAMKTATNYLKIIGTKV